MQHRRPTFQKWISVLLLPCYLGACTSWHRDTQPLPKTLAAEPAPKLRVTLTNGQPITLTDAQQVGDSVVGKMTLTLEQLREPGVRERHPRYGDGRIQSLLRLLWSNGLLSVSPPTGPPTRGYGDVGRFRSRGAQS